MSTDQEKDKIRRKRKNALKNIGKIRRWNFHNAGFGDGNPIICDKCGKKAKKGTIIYREGKKIELCEKCR